MDASGTGAAGSGMLRSRSLLVLGAKESRHRNANHELCHLRHCHHLAQALPESVLDPRDSHLPGAQELGSRFLRLVARGLRGERHRGATRPDLGARRRRALEAVRGWSRARVERRRRVARARRRLLASGSF